MIWLSKFSEAGEDKKMTCTAFYWDFEIDQFSIYNKSTTKAFAH